MVVGKAVGEERVEARNGAAIEADAVLGKAKGSSVRAKGSGRRDGSPSHRAFPATVTDRRKDARVPRDVVAVDNLDGSE